MLCIMIGSIRRDFFGNGGNVGLGWVSIVPLRARRSLSKYGPSMRDLLYPGSSNTISPHLRTSVHPGHGLVNTDRPLMPLDNGGYASCGVGFHLSIIGKSSIE